MFCEFVSEDDKIKERMSLMGKIFTDRQISKVTIGGLMGKIWCISKPAIFSEVGSNSFIVTFATEIDKQRVINGKLWLFDGHLFALQNLDGAC